MTFSDVVEAVKQLPIDEKQALNSLLTQYLREERREEIYRNSEAARAKAGLLKFSNDADELMHMLAE